MNKQRSVLAFLLLATLAAPTLAGDVVRVVKSAHPEGEGLRLTLAPEIGASWREVNVGRVAIRSAREHRRLPAERFEATPHLDLTLPQSGCSLVLVDVGPASEKGHPDSWRRTHRTSKIVACPETADPREALGMRIRAGAVLMSKGGGRIEIRPLVNPAVLAAGSDLPVRIYFDNVPQPGVGVLALGPEGERLTATTDGAGVANFTIPSGGPWVIRYLTRRQAVPFMAEFEIEALAEPLPSEALRAGQSLPSSAPAEEWQSLGPAPIDFRIEYEGFLTLVPRDTGRAAAIVASATRPSRYYLGGGSGGVWATVDGGASWTPMTDHLPSLAIGALALDPNDDQIVYAGSGEANNASHSLYGLGLYKSTDGGRSWRILARRTFAGRTFSRLVVSPFDRQLLWAAVGRAGGAREHPGRGGAMGLFRSTDGGATWEHLADDHGLPTFVATDVDLDPRDRRRLYASFAHLYGHTTNGIYLSTDGGESFVRIGPNIDGERIGRIVLDIAPSDPNRLYALVSHRIEAGSSTSNTTLGVFRSDDGGSTWTFTDPGNFQAQQAHYNAVIAVHPGDSNTVFLGGVEMLRSTDGGATFVEITPNHVDIHDITFDALGRMLVADDGGLHRSPDGLGDRWGHRNTGVGMVQFYPGLSLDPTVPETVLAGTQDNGTNLRLGISHPWPSSATTGDWVRIFGGDGGQTVIKPDEPEVLFVQYQGTGTIYRSSNGGLNFLRRTTGIDLDDRNGFLQPLVVDPANTRRLLYATYRVYESTDLGDHWNVISGDLTAGPPAAVRALAIAPSDSNVVYAATTDGRVLVSNNAGHDWDLSLEGVGGWSRITRQLAVDPLRPSLAYVAAMRFGSERLLMTKDRGQSWQAIDEGLPNFPVNTVGVYRTDQRRYLLVGTDAGVYVSANNGGRWRPYGTGLPRAPVMDLVVDAERQRLVISTLGRGIWTIGLPQESTVSSVP